MSYTGMFAAALSLALVVPWRVLWPHVLMRHRLAADHWLCAGFEKNGDTDLARQITEEMHAAGIQSAVLPQVATHQKVPQYMEQFQRKIKPVCSYLHSLPANLLLLYSA